ncbi:alpha/beta hydrolase [Niabella beijingensis]|uniref:alpha/beta hydrolase n=1 Tax=Niabella beijingensis TaxID=2872700 RepID=UPI001CBD0272|nr:alpha/beta hydrolase-fold protein [Niabella beijingensis]MBZ4189442.1 hypothetical protein [Niabella beijingensis]
MRKKGILLLLLWFSIVAQAQDLNNSFAATKLHSGILNEDREVYISLPPNYQHPRYLHERYPVLYFFDGETSTGLYKAVTQFLSKGVYAHMPEVILVGIKNKDRTKDLTPTRSSIKSPDDNTRQLFENSGGNDRFTQFIKEELFAYINEHYRTDGFNILSGHSFGGLAASNILLHHTSLFNAYILIDPSIWWDEGYIAREATRLVPLKEDAVKMVYMARANNKAKSGSLDSGDDTAERFHQVLSKHKSASLIYQYKWFEQEDHGTILLPALYEGLKFIFDGYEVDFKEVSDRPEAIIDAYKKLTERTGHAFLPSCQKLDFIIAYFEANKKIKESEIIRRQRKQLYPEEK